MSKMSLTTDLKISKLIDDSTVSPKTTYSSNKIEQLVGTINNTVNNVYENVQTIDFKFSEEYTPAEIGDRVVFYINTDQVISEYKGEDLGWEHLEWDASALYFDTENSVLYAYNTEAGELIEITVPNTFIVTDLNKDTKLKTVKTAGTYNVIQHLNSAAHGSYLKNWVMTVTSVDYDDEEYQTGDKWYQVLVNNVTLKKRSWSATRQTNDGWSTFSTYYKGETKDSITTPSKYYTYSQFKTKELLDTKQDVLIVGNNVSIDSNTISAKGYRYDDSLKSFAEGTNTTASGNGSHAEGYAYGGTIEASGNGAHAEGCTAHENSTIDATGIGAHAEGYAAYGASIQATGIGAHAEGYNTIASGDYGSHAEGMNTKATGDYSHAEGQGSTADIGSHAEGENTQASGAYTHAEGIGTTASRNGSHAEGYRTTASGNYSHAEGATTTASGQGSHAEGAATTAQNLTEHAEGRCNLSHNNPAASYGDYRNTQHSVGIGTDTDNRKNAFEIMQNGDVYVYNIGGYQGTDIKTSTNTIQTLQEYIASLESELNTLKSELNTLKTRVSALEPPSTPS